MTARLLGIELLDELRTIVREPTALFFSIVMPVGFFALFVSMFGGYNSGDLTAGTRMIGTFGTFGVLAVTLMNPGISVAQDREIGWLRVKRVQAVPLPVTLVAKVIATLPYAMGVLLAMTATAAVTGNLHTSALDLLRLYGVLLLGAVPFALLGLAVGCQARPNATTAVLNAILMPAAVVSGLWMPLEILPGFFGSIAHFLPTYHLGELAVAQLDGGQVAGHVAALAGWTVVMAAVAGLSYRRARL
ncbi:ABC transporter permease [Saccharomonospora xinjiangensis]|uniref:ABC-type multidrug transport system, permease component n=1 Tax=Saccharomonospora xinjiangensis XJ-54 TaxID=882086 RepID=I0V1Q9_9PSEU|nr:ABC transporter permease [Saccharomonospora xinjiangensis]EID54062.1 ABC-type multidrug transport system, permease component [Saccharomonospora xinjiangensis XJ-54]